MATKKQSNEEKSKKEEKKGREILEIPVEGRNTTTSLDLTKYRKVNKETIALLREAFTSGATIKQACIHANIHEATYHRFKQDNLEVCESLEACRENLALAAKMRLYTTLKADPKSGQLALATLERVEKDNYSTRQEIKKEETRTERIEIVVVTNEEVKERKRQADIVEVENAALTDAA